MSQDSAPEFPYAHVFGDSLLTRMASEFDWNDKLQGYFMSQVHLRGTKHAPLPGTAVGSPVIIDAWSKASIAGGCLIEPEPAGVKFCVTLDPAFNGRSVVILLICSAAKQRLQEAGRTKDIVAEIFRAPDYAALDTEVARLVAAVPYVCGHVAKGKLEHHLELDEAVQPAELQDLTVVVLVGK